MSNTKEPTIEEIQAKRDEIASVSPELQEAFRKRDEAGAHRINNLLQQDLARTVEEAIDIVDTADKAKGRKILLAQQDFEIILDKGDDVIVSVPQTGEEIRVGNLNDGVFSDEVDEKPPGEVKEIRERNWREIGKKLSDILNTIRSAKRGEGN